MNVTILLASPSTDRLCSWKQSLEVFSAATVVTNLDALKEELVRIKPEVLLLDLDLPDLDGTKGIARLMKLNPATRIIALSEEKSDDGELALFRIGVRACCCRDIDLQLLKSVVAAVKQGELWIRRTLTPRLLDELGARIRDDSESRRATIARLTRREREIADLIGKGECNKQIARQLTITESTVKAHLTEIFRKLGIADRLKLALIVINLQDV